MTSKQDYTTLQISREALKGLDIFRQRLQYIREGADVSRIEALVYAISVASQQTDKTSKVDTLSCK